MAKLSLTLWRLKIGAALFKAHKQLKKVRVLHLTYYVSIDY